MSFVAKILRALIWIYRHSLSYFLGRSCRFEPSCSSYANEAIKRFGASKGSWLAIKRILKCNPWGGSGYDPVPPSLKEDEKH